MPSRAGGRADGDRDHPTDRKDFGSRTRSIHPGQGSVSSSNPTWPCCASLSPPSTDFHAPTSPAPTALRLVVAGFAATTGPGAPRKCGVAAPWPGRNSAPTQGRPGHCSSSLTDRRQLTQQQQQEIQNAFFILYYCLITLYRMMRRKKKLGSNKE